MCKYNYLFIAAKAENVTNMKRLANLNILPLLCVAMPLLKLQECNQEFQCNAAFPAPEHHLCCGVVTDAVADVARGHSPEAVAKSSTQTCQGTLYKQKKTKSRHHCDGQKRSVSLTTIYTSSHQHHHSVGQRIKKGSWTMQQINTVSSPMPSSVSGEGWHPCNW